MRRLLQEIPGRDLALIALPLLVLLALAIWGITHFVPPAPPRTVVMSTGAPDGAYHAFAQRYRSILAEYGVTLELRPSSGAVENLERLMSRQGGVSVALVQGGIANAGNAPGLVTLGSLFYEPSWLFYRAGQDIDLGLRLRGKRVAIGVPGSGTRAVALRVLHEIGVAEPAAALREIGGLEAAKALEAGEVDAVFYMASHDAPGVQRLLEAPGVRLLGARRAETFVRRMPFLHKLTLPEGAADLKNNIPPTDITLLAVTANLVAVEDIHPVIVDLLLEAAKKVHGGGGMFQRAGEFPAPRDLDLPLSPDAQDFYKGNPSVLKSYLPFWMVVWVNRFIVVGIPLLILSIPFFRFVPAMYNWTTRRRIYRWYRDLRAIEQDLIVRGSDPALLSARLDQLKSKVDHVRVPHAYSGEHYDLIGHIQLVRNRLEELQSK